MSKRIVETKTKLKSPTPLETNTHYIPKCNENDSNVIITPHLWLDQVEPAPIQCSSLSTIKTIKPKKVKTSTKLEENDSKKSKKPLTLQGEIPHKTKDKIIKKSLKPKITTSPQEHISQDNLPKDLLEATAEQTPLSFSSEALSSSPDFLFSNPLRILSQRVIEKEVRIPKLVRRKELFETVKVIPTVQRREEIVQEPCIVKEKIRQIERYVTRETTDTPRDEDSNNEEEDDDDDDDNATYLLNSLKDFGNDGGDIDNEIRTIIERPEIEVHEDIIEVPKVIHQERIIEIPDIQYRQVSIERLVEAPDFTEQHTIVKREDEEASDEIYIRDPLTIVTRNIPLPMEHVVNTTFDLQSIETHYIDVDVPIYVPRFIEIPCPFEALDDHTIEKVQSYTNHLTALSLEQNGVSLMEAEELMTNLKNIRLEDIVVNEEILQNRFTNLWKNGTFPIYHHNETNNNTPVAAEAT